jgi:hypothetical protein
MITTANPGNTPHYSVALGTACLVSGLVLGSNTALATATDVASATPYQAIGRCIGC